MYPGCSEALLATIISRERQSLIPAYENDVLNPHLTVE